MHSHARHTHSLQISMTAHIESRRIMSCHNNRQKPPTGSAPGSDAATAAGTATATSTLQITFTLSHLHFHTLSDVSPKGSPQPARERSIWRGIRGKEVGGVRGREGSWGESVACGCGVLSTCDMSCRMHMQHLFSLRRHNLHQSAASKCVCVCMRQLCVCSWKKGEIITEFL